MRLLLGYVVDTSSLYFKRFLCSVPTLQFLAYHTQLLMGNRSNTISPEDYIFGALSLYVDIVQIFLFLLQLTGSSSD